MLELSWIPEDQQDEYVENYIIIAYDNIFHRDSLKAAISWILG